MRLIPKNEIDKKRAEENRQKMQEGLQIAEKVDSLREISASEEEAFEKYRIQRLKVIQEEIAKKIEEKNILEQDCSRLKIEVSNYNRELVEPLDNLWMKVNEKQSEVDLKIKEFKRLNADFLAKEKTIDEQLTLSSEKLENIEVKERKTVENYQRSDLLKKEAEQINLKSLEDRKKRENVLIDKEKVIEDMFTQSVNDKKSNQTYADLLKKREIELNNRERKIDDKYATLLRTLNRKI